MNAVEQLLAEVRLHRRLPDPAVRRLLRLRAGLSQQQMAAVLNVDRSAISRWELGSRNPRGRLLADYVDLLDRLAREEIAA
jgi:transcriptional regulator with XRE-family HTH domain